MARAPAATPAERCWRDGRQLLDLLVTEQIGLEDVNAALDAMRRGDGARQVVVY